MTLWAKAETGDALKGVWPVTDKAMMRSLNGQWLLKVVSGINDKKEVPEPDATWGKIPVPGCWESHGFCKPKYDYPDSLTGYYRTAFEVPREWKGLQVFIRLDGVLRGYNLWLNGQLVGTWESAYNTCIFDLTPYLRKKGPQQLALRVYTRFKGYEFDCFDDWAANGIFRDVTLMAVPRTHLSDLTVTTAIDGTVNVSTRVNNATRHTTVSHELLDAEGRPVNGSRPHLWTAETPYLYTLNVYVKEKKRMLQTFTQKIGIREVNVEGNLLKINGQPVKLRGVNAHATDPRTGKVIGDTLTLKDMRMMKEASVNFLRLSHYPREPRFYELADSLGFYLVSEVPFGYGTNHLNDTTYQALLMTRANATVSRDKNHPSVILWSVGNENPLTRPCIEVGDSVGRLDQSRPYCFPQVGSYFRRFWEKHNDTTLPAFPSKAPVYAPHYPTTGQIGGFYQHLDRPVVFTEYCHSLGISFEDHDRQWEIIERTPGIAGGAVWEWADQGIRFDAVGGLEPYGYEERVFCADNETMQGFEMHGNKGTDGLVYADRTPLPNYYELKRNYAQAFVADSMLTIGNDNALNLHIVNRYDFINLKDNITFTWSLTEDRDTTAQGCFSPNCQPHGQTVSTLQLASTPDSRRLVLLHVDITDSLGRNILRQSIPVGEHDVTARLLNALKASADPMAMVQDGPMVRAGRKATMAERLKVGDKRLEPYLLHLSPDGHRAGPIVCDVKTEPCGSAVHVSFALTPDSTDTFLSELGLAFLLDRRIDRVQWIGQGPFATYPGRYRANRYGAWDMQQDDVYFEGNRRGVDAALLTDADGKGLLLLCRKGDISFEQTDRGIVVTYNVAVAGQGPKFARTAFPVVAENVGTVSGDFYLYRVDRANMPELFINAKDIKKPLHPFATQYDTYLMRFEDIAE